MFDYCYTETEYGGVGILPTGEEREFVNEHEYAEAYQHEEDEIYDFIAECMEPVDWPEDW